MPRLLACQWGRDRQLPHWGPHPALAQAAALLHSSASVPVLLLPLPRGGQGEPAGSTHVGSLLCPESGELTPCHRAKLRKGLFPFSCSQSSFLPIQAWLFLLCWRRQHCLKQHRPLQSLNATRCSWPVLSLLCWPAFPRVFVFGEVTSGKICSGKRLRSTGFTPLPAHRVLRSQGFLFGSLGLRAELSLPTRP